MRIKSILASMLVIAALASCSDNNDVPTPPVGGDFQTAYLSLRVTYPTSMTRASSEDDATAEESAINSLYVVTFDEDKKLVHHSKENPVIVINGSSTTPDAIRVNPKTNFLLVIANPGEILKSRLGALTSGTAFDDFNKVITVTVGTAAGESRDLLANEVRTKNGSTAENFTMINAGFYDESSSKWGDDCLLDVTSKVVKVEGSTAEAETDAKNEAEGSRAKLMIERLSAKMIVSVSGTAQVLPSGAKFNFQNWALDYRNSTFYPFAKKTKTASDHANGGEYKSNFYTVDPNFETGSHTTGIIANEVDATTRAHKVTWNLKDAADYCIENTMKETEQRYGAATRVVIKAQYVPDAAFDLGKDWYYFSGESFQTLAILQTRYSTTKASNPTAPLVMACDKFLAAVKAANDGINANATFTDLDQVNDLDGIENGGEVTKIEDCIRWYQGSVNYYIYEIRHDNDPDLDKMAYGKYGVVRNNWYGLNLTKVTGKGTPWYPGGGPGDPDPEDPIDEDAAYLAFDITVGPWIYWTTDFEI